MIKIKKTLHRGVTVTMASVRSRYWFSSLRQQTISVAQNIMGTRKHCALTYHSPEPLFLPVERTGLSMLFQVIGGKLCKPNIIVPNLKKNEKHIFFCILAVLVEMCIYNWQKTKHWRGRSKVIYSEMQIRFKLQQNGWGRLQKIKRDISIKLIS